MKKSHALISLAGLLVFLAILVVPATAQSPSFLKVFVPDTIGLGSTSTLTFTITNSASTGIMNLAFTDNLPAGVVIATPANPTTDCPDSTVSAPDGGSTITFSGDFLGAGKSCTITVQVTATAAATYSNTSSALTFTGGNFAAASDDLTVEDDRPGFSKSFSPDTVSLGGRSTLTFLIDNSANSSGAFQLQFVDNLPSGMAVASPANRSTTCSGGTITANPGGGQISYSSAASTTPSVPANSTCSVSVDIVGNAVGNLVNTSEDMMSARTPNGVIHSSGKASDTLTVTSNRLTLSKTFTDDPVPPGDTVTLRFTVRNLDRSDAATGISFTDDLEATLSGLEAVGLPLDDPCGTGSELTGTSIITLTGGNLPEEGSCTFDVTLQVPSAASVGLFPNTTSEITGDVGGDSETGDPAADTLFVLATPILTKTFMGDPVGAGGSVDIEFSITNTSSTSIATDIAFVDELTGSTNTDGSLTNGFLPFPVSVTLPPTPDPPCGMGSSLALISLGTNRQGLSLTDGNLAANETCTFTVTLDIPVGLPNGIYVNTTGEVTATVGGQTVEGKPASDDLTVVSAPALIKEFTDDPVAAGSPVTLEFTLTHDDLAPDTATGISFSDNLEATLSGLTATGLPQNDICGAGSTLEGTSNLMFSGGTLAPGETCTFSVTLDTPSDAPSGKHTNTTSGVVATVLGVSATENAASDDLRIAGLTLSKEFIDDPARPGGTVTLRFTIQNESATSSASNIAFIDNLDDTLEGLTATGLPLNDVCGSGSSLTGSDGDKQLNLMSGSLAAGASCTFDVVLNVPDGAAEDDYPNSTQNFSANIGGSPIAFDNATDVLSVVSSFLALTKEFLQDPVAPGGMVTLRFTLTNLDSGAAASDIEFMDDLDAALAGLVSVSGTQTDICGTGSQITGSGLLQFTGGNLGAGASCSFDVVLQVPSQVNIGTLVVNTTSGVSGMIGGNPVTGDPATDTLLLAFLTFAKEFSSEAAPGGTVDLTFTIENLDGANSVSDLGFQDDLDAALSGLIAIGLPAANVCGSGSVLDGTSFLSLIQGSLLPGGSCTFSVLLQVPATATPGNYVNTTSNLELVGLPVADPAIDTLMVVAEADEDQDGVQDVDDVCAGTVIPESVPTQQLKPNRYALVDDDGIFDTVSKGKNDDSSNNSDDASSDASDDGSDDDSSDDGPRVFTIQDTRGCSCEQIIEELDLGKGHVKFGCSLGAMRTWVDLVNPSQIERQPASRVSRNGGQ